MKIERSQMLAPPAALAGSGASSTAVAMPLHAAATIPVVNRDRDVKGSGDQAARGNIAIVVDTRQWALTGLALASAGVLIWQVVDPNPVRGFGLTLDRLSAILGLLVSAVGSVTFRFSRRYLDGDPNRERFLDNMTFAVLSAFVLMLSSNLLLLFIAWTATSVVLHRLLTHYAHRPEAIRAARKKFLISRIGDLALVAAIVTVWVGWGTLDLHTFLATASVAPIGSGATAVALLIVLAAVTKSAQFPFHSWLPETMESPTPVSALMHAGIINAGGALLLRCSPLLAQVPSALMMLAIIGAATAVFGTLAMWAQVKVKRTLAWSTVSQMGFMTVQCGLGAFGAALLHIVAHGFYKAWSFLRSGELPSPAVSKSVEPAAPKRVLTIAAIGTLVAVPAMALAARVTGFSPLHSPGELALAAILALSAGQLWVALLRVDGRGASAVFGRAFVAVTVTVGGSIIAFALYHGAARFLSPAVGATIAPTGPAAWVTAAVAIAAVLLLVVLHAVLPSLGHTPFGRALRVHALHGFYFGALADRLVAFIWGVLPSSSVKGASHV